MYILWIRDEPILNGRASNGGTQIGCTFEWVGYGANGDAELDGIRW
jgi:hypothetical protein